MECGLLLNNAAHAKGDTSCMQAYLLFKDGKEWYELQKLAVYQGTC